MAEVQSMTSFADSINLVIAGIGLALCLSGLSQALIDQYMERKTRRYFIAFFSVLIAYALSNLLGQFTEGRPGFWWVLISRLFMFLQSLFSALLMPMLTAFLIESAGDEQWRKRTAFRVSLALFLIYLGLLIYTQFSTTIYFFDESSVYHRGPWYPVLLIPPVLLMAVNMVAYWNRRSRFSKKQRIAFSAYLLGPTVAMLIQMSFFGLYTILLGTTISAFFMFAYVQSDSIKRYAMQEQENLQLRTDIMLSQIQPHFLYNSLGAIQQLCKNDTEARDAIGKFSRYLRGNMDSIDQNKPIPFTSELEHTRIYLELEQMRFGDELNVEYDLTCTDFLIPTLALQPLVENAVHYGVRGSETGKGTVTIATREKTDRYEITVSDDGPGFDPDVEKRDGRSHIGIRNVRERLMRTCGGELIVESEPGRGSRATIVLPKGDSEC